MKRMYFALGLATGALLCLGAALAGAQTARDTLAQRAVRVYTDSTRKETCRGGVLSASGLSCSGAKYSTRVTYVRRFQNKIDSIMAALLVAAPAPVPVPPPPTPPPPPDTTTTPTPPPPSTTLATRAALPLDSVDVSWPTITRQVTVCAGCSLQTAIQNAQGGDELLLTPGATYTGPFYLTARSCSSGWVVIRTGGTLPVSPGFRMRPSLAGSLAKLTGGAANEPVLRANVGANCYRIVGLEIVSLASVTSLGNLVRLGDGNIDQGTNAPSRIILDRDYIHGTATISLQRCVFIGGPYQGVIDSWLSDCHAAGFDSQAILITNGGGPLLVQNNHLSAPGETFMSGGANSWAAANTPHDLTIRRNHFYRPASWIGGPWTVKTTLEIKYGRRILIEGNVFDGNWEQAHQGYVFNLKTSVDEAFNSSEDITIRYNRIVRHGNGFGMSEKEGAGTVGLRRVTIEQNVIDSMNVAPFTAGQSKFFIIARTATGVEDVLIQRNTFLTTSASLLFASVQCELVPTMVRWSFNQNVMLLSPAPPTQPIKASGYSGTTTIQLCAPSYEWLNNVLIGSANGQAYPATTVFVTSVSAVPAGVGADLALVASRTAGVVVPP